MRSGARPGPTPRSNTRTLADPLGREPKSGPLPPPEMRVKAGRRGGQHLTYSRASLCINSSIFNCGLPNDTETHLVEVAALPTGKWLFSKGLCSATAQPTVTAPSGASGSTPTQTVPSHTSSAHATHTHQRPGHQVPLGSKIQMGVTHGPPKERGSRVKRNPRLQSIRVQRGTEERAPHSMWR